MRDAVIISTARTPIAKAYRGAFNATPPQTIAGHASAAAVNMCVGGCKGAAGLFEVF